jgi:5-formyltetrahydrofolate cyclo-ligase
MNDAKALLRKEALTLRSAAHEAARGPGDATLHLLSALAGHHGRVIAGYMPMRSEIDPLPAMTLLAETSPIVVPVIAGKGQRLKFRRWRPGCKLEEGPFGALVPVSGEELEPEALIVPLVAFDGLGHRLGYGGGFYDRTLEALRAAHRVLAVGFAYAAQEVAAVPVEPTDARLDMIVTEAGARQPH